MNDIPAGFDAIYRCDKHPDREVVVPIACRRCQECKEDAQRAYAEKIERDPRWRPEHDLTTCSETLDESKVKKRRETII